MAFALVIGSNWARSIPSRLPIRNGACATADVKEEAEDKKDQLEEGRNRVKQTVEATTDKAGDVSSGVRDQVKHVVGEAQEACQQVAVRSQEVFRNADAAVRENPHWSVGAALGAGLFVGMLIGIALRSGRVWNP
jgi:ElaB/YqjD/DUF883 family membrane-anchored ribosome-binding protein